jgi:hypothetical protein
MIPDFTIFKIEYDWYEGEHREILLGKKTTRKRFENDLMKAREFAEGLIGKEVEKDYLGKGYAVECLPEFYEQIIWHLTNKSGYIECEYDDSVEYSIDDDSCRRITLTKSEKKTERAGL